MMNYKKLLVNAFGFWFPVKLRMFNPCHELFGILEPSGVGSPDV